MRQPWSTPLAHDVDGGWTVRRRPVNVEAAGVCTRCVVGLGPPTGAGLPRAA